MLHDDIGQRSKVNLFILKSAKKLPMLKFNTQTPISKRIPCT